MSLTKLEKIGKTVNIKNLIYRKNEYMYNFRNFGTINTFGRYIYNGVVTLKEADKDQSSLLVETLNFKSKIKPQNPAKKLYIYIYILYILKTYMYYLMVEKGLLLLHK